MLRANQAQRNISALLRWQLQRDPQEIQEYGGQVLWMPLVRGLTLTYRIWSNGGIAGKHICDRCDVLYIVVYIKFLLLNLFFSFFNSTDYCDI